MAYLSSSSNIFEESVFSYADESFILAGDYVDDFSPNDFFANDYDCRISPPISQVYQPFYDLDTKWRSVATLSPHQSFSRPSYAQDNSNEVNSIEHDKIPNNTIKNNNGDNKFKIELSSEGSQLDGALYKAVEQPLYLVPTHFHTYVPLKCIVRLIKKSLSTISELSFQMNTDQECSVRFELLCYFFSLIQRTYFFTIR